MHVDRCTHCIAWHAGIIWVVITESGLSLPSFLSRRHDRLISLRTYFTILWAISVHQLSFWQWARATLCIGDSFLCKLFSVLTLHCWFWLVSLEVTWNLSQSPLVASWEDSSSRILLRRERANESWDGHPTNFQEIWDRRRRRYQLLAFVRLMKLLAFRSFSYLFICLFVYHCLWFVSVHFAHLPAL